MWEYIQTHWTHALLPNDWFWFENQTVKNSLLDCIARNSDVSAYNNILFCSTYRLSNSILLTHATSFKMLKELWLYTREWIRSEWVWFSDRANLQAHPDDMRKVTLVEKLRCLFISVYLLKSTLETVARFIRARISLEILKLSCKLLTVPELLRQKLSPSKNLHTSLSPCNFEMWLQSYKTSYEQIVKFIFLRLKFYLSGTLINDHNSPPDWSI